MASTEWHNVGAYRFGWDVRLDASRFIVLRREGGWRVWRRRYVPLARGLVEYGLVADAELRERARNAIEISPGLHAADMRLVMFKVDSGGADLDARLQHCMALRWHQMQVRLRTG